RQDHLRDLKLVAPVIELVDGYEALGFEVVDQALVVTGREIPAANLCGRVEGCHLIRRLIDAADRAERAVLEEARAVRQANLRVLDRVFAGLRLTILTAVRDAEADVRDELLVILEIAPTGSLPELALRCPV